MTDVIDTPVTVPAEIDADERARLNRARFERWGSWALPLIVMALMVFLWDRIVVWYDIKHYILPGPGRVLNSLIEGQAVFFDAWVLTLAVTAAALALAVIFGVGLAVLFTQSRLIEMSLYPYAVILQVTPVVSIAPLIFIYVDSK
ncbi:MAG: ABC transporter permease, partial [Pseudomonadota bacterium]